MAAIAQATRGYNQIPFGAAALGIETPREQRDTHNRSSGSRSLNQPQARRNAYGAGVC